MPNWVNNSLIITGDAARVQAVKTRLAEPYERVFSKFVKGEHVTATETVEQGFSFWNMIRPEGEELEKYNDSLGAGGAFPFWYGWNCNNWGTKWDTDAEFEEYAENDLHYLFATAWSPPIEAITALSAKFPDVHFELEFEEEQGWGGTTVFSEGVATNTDSYDIPTSHEEYESRDDRECSCQEWNEKIFDDCPVEEVTPDMVVAKDELLIEQMI
jgi:hypothetical protein